MEPRLHSKRYDDAGRPGCAAASSSSGYLNLPRPSSFDRGTSDQSVAEPTGRDSHRRGGGRRSCRRTERWTGAQAGAFCSLRRRTGPHRFSHSLPNTSPNTSTRPNAARRSSQPHARAALRSQFLSIQGVPVGDGAGLRVTAGVSRGPSIEARDTSVRPGVAVLFHGRERLLVQQ